ncbi:MAG: hypothetical protein DCF30_15055 [Hyphomicrobiales bacterium]|nr:MAG: hypothetical protein DCF30_15055 [Hyphomicrobiales bacterium]
MAVPRPSYGWYGDDFTGATDTLATLAQGGMRALLFLGLPSQRNLLAAGPLDAIGIAGASRAMPPAEMAVELDAVGRFFAELKIGLLHYKCCSTFDSSPHIGSIGAAVRALRPHVRPGPVPVVGGQPNLGRYCIFGNLFAAAGSNGIVHRIDRHPTMSVHPVTPMREADLRRHLALQGLDPVGLIDHRAYEGDVHSHWLADMEAEAIVLDIICARDIAAIGALLARLGGDGPLLAVGPSSVAQAFVAASGNAPGAPVVAPPARDKAGHILALVGSLSPVTRLQVETASGYAKTMIDPLRLISDGDYRENLRSAVVEQLASGHVMLSTNRPEGTPGNPGDVAVATAALLRAIVDKVRPSRLVVAGGDTSSRAIQAMDIWGLSYEAAFVTGAPNCRAHSDSASLDGLSVILKGGQVGPNDFFNMAAKL